MDLWEENRTFTGPLLKILEDYKARKEAIDREGRERRSKVPIEIPLLPNIMGAGPTVGEGAEALHAIAVQIEELQAEAFEIALNNVLALVKKTFCDETYRQFVDLLGKLGTLTYYLDWRSRLLDLLLAGLKGIGISEESRQVIKDLFIVAMAVVALASIISAVRRVLQRWRHGVSVPGHGPGEDLGKRPGGLGEETPALKAGEWRPGEHHSETQWANKMADRGWTPKMIDEAVEGRSTFPAENRVHPGNTATRYVHPKTGLSVVIDDVTKEVLYIEKEGHVNPWSK